MVKKAAQAKGKRGGARPGSGRKKGWRKPEQSPEKRFAELCRKRIERVFPHIDSALEKKPGELSLSDTLALGRYLAEYGVGKPTTMEAPDPSNDAEVVMRLLKTGGHKLNEKELTIFNKAVSKLAGGAGAGEGAALPKADEEQFVA